MTIQQLLAQHSVEDIVRYTITLYDLNTAKYPKLYANYATLIEGLLKLEAVPTDDVLLGIVYEDDGESHMDTAVYKAETMARPIPYNLILENTVDTATLSDETLDAGIRSEVFPESYSYLFVPWAEIMGYQVNKANLEDVGAIPLLVDTLYELTFFGFAEADMETERHILDESAAEAEALEALSPEEQDAYYAETASDIDEWWDELGLPPKSPEERAQERLKMQHELFRNTQRLYHALRRYCGSDKRNVFEIQGCVSTAPDVSHDEFLDAFIEFVESKGWYFGGGTKDVTEDDIEVVLDEADMDAEATDVRYTNEDVFGKD